MINAVEARTLARSIFEARREGRKLKPLTNTRLLSMQDALAIQDALIDLRLANNETLLGWALIDDEHVAPIMTSNLVDDRVVMGVPSHSVDVRVEPVVVLGAKICIGLRAMDRLMPGALTEDVVAAGHGLVSVVVGDELPHTYSEGIEIRAGRTKQTLSGAFDGMRQKIESALHVRKREIEPGQILISPALMMGEPLERGGEMRATFAVGDTSLTCSLRHL